MPKSVLSLARSAREGHGGRSFSEERSRQGSDRSSLRVFVGPPHTMILSRSRFGLGKGHLGFLICDVMLGVSASLKNGYDN
jgi:hypothetical protein